MHIAVVDDFPLFRKAIITELSSIIPNLIVHEAENGLQGLELIKARPIELVILDLAMPEMDGFEFLEKIRIHRLKTFKTIAFTLYNEPMIVHRLLEFGVEGYVPKNANIDVLIEAIKTVQRWTFLFERI